MIVLSRPITIFYNVPSSMGYSFFFPIYSSGIEMNENVKQYLKITIT